MKHVTQIAALLATVAASPVVAGEVKVTAPAGLFTNSGPTGVPGSTPALDTWYANNVRANGSVGITSTQARSGNGSIQFTGPANAKADLEYYFNPTARFALSDLTGYSYDFYRDAGSSASATFHPSLRLFVSDGTRSGYLVYEGVYNGQSTAPVDTWVTTNVVTASGGMKIWGTGNLPDAFSNYNRTAADWVALLPNLQVLGFSTGIGSGWDGSFNGAVDNISFTRRGGETTTFNFELADAAVPEPATWGLMLLGFGMVGAGLRSRRTAVRFA